MSSTPLFRTGRNFRSAIPAPATVGRNSNGYRWHKNHWRHGSGSKDFGKKYPTRAYVCYTVRRRCRFNTTSNYLETNAYSTDLRRVHGA